jgi:hypothetical protein
VPRPRCRAKRPTGIPPDSGLWSRRPRVRVPSLTLFAPGNLGLLQAERRRERPRCRAKYRRRPPGYTGSHPGGRSDYARVRDLRYGSASQPRLREILIGVHSCRRPLSHPPRRAPPRAPQVPRRAPALRLPPPGEATAGAGAQMAPGLPPLRLSPGFPWAVRALLGSWHGGGPQVRFLLNAAASVPSHATLWSML